MLFWRFLLAGVVAKLMCIDPFKVEKSLLLVPSGIKKAPKSKSLSMFIPLVFYCFTHRESWLKKWILPLALTEDNISTDTLETVKNVFEHVKIQSSMPSNVNPKKMKRCKAPTLVMVGEKDCLFPANRVIRQAKAIIPNCETYVIKNRGHMHFLTDEEKQKIIDFLLIN